MRILLILFCSALVGCSTLKNKTLLAGAASFAVCSLIGSNSAPKDENKNMHGALYGGLCSTAAMAITELIEDGPKDRELKKLREQQLQLEDSEIDIRKQILKSKSIKSLDKSVQESLKGNWDVFTKTEWFFDGKKLRHENMEIEFKD